MPSLPAPSAQAHPDTPSSVIFSGRMDWADNTRCVEVWHLILTPTERIRSLNIAPIIAKLDSPLLDVDSCLQAGLQETVMIGDRLFLLGSRPAQNSNQPSKVLNRYLEVPLRRLCASNSKFVTFATVTFVVNLIFAYLGIPNERSLSQTRCMLHVED